MKRYFFAVAAAFVVALIGAGGALATDLSSPASAPGLLPNLAPQSEAWLNALSVLPAAPTPAPAPKPAPRPAPSPQAQPQPAQPVQAATLSIYEHSAQPWILAAQGCAAATRQESGIVVLDFGMPKFERGGYGSVIVDCVIDRGGQPG